jgi:DNA-binding NtrC family response regulator
MTTPSTPPATGDPPGEAGAKPRVLVIDDEMPNLQTFRRVFRNDFQVTLAASVDEALAIIQQQPIDLALVDYSMPGKNGIHFLQAVKTLQPSLRCLMLTAHGDLDEVRRAHQSGLTLGVIMKPWNKETILRWVDNTLRLASMKRSIGDMKDALKDK